MAFVNRSDRGLEQKVIPMDDLGPGTYCGHSEYYFQEKSVAFQSKEERQLFKLNQNIPGPGQYNIEDTNEGQKVLLQQGNSELQVLELLKQQSSFRSMSKRFEDFQRNQPGPGQYDNSFGSIGSNKRIYQFKQNPKSIIDHLMNINRYQTIPSIPAAKQIYGYTEREGNHLEINKSPETIHSGLKTDTVGPGQYNLSKDFINGGTTWHKSKVPKQVTDICRGLELSVGPGVYDIQENNQVYKIKPSSYFISKTQRTQDSRKGSISQEFLKERLKKSMKSFQANSITTNDDESEDIEYVDNSTPGPGYYFTEVQQSTTISYNKQRTARYKKDIPHAFGSQQRRFHNILKPLEVGPGEYELSKKHIYENTIQAKKVPFICSDIRFKKKINQNGPSPQDYQIKQSLEYKLLQSLQKSPLNKMVSIQQRFKESQDCIPGPGEYNLNDNQDEWLLKPQYNFKSKQKRELFPQYRGLKQLIINIQDENPPPGSYEITHLSIQKNTHVEKELDPQLEIKKPPFNSSLPRFDLSSTRSKIIEETDEIEDNKKDINQMFIKKSNKNAPFDSKNPRFDYRIKERPPGPGEYFNSKRNIWNKKTFNILFAEI